MKTPKVHRLFIRQSFLPGLIAFAGCLLFCVSLAWGEPVNLLYVPLTNNAPGITTMPSDTSKGGVSINLTMFNASGVASDLAGATGSGVNGAANSASAMCLTNGAGGVQPAAGNGERALDNNDATLGLGTLTNFAITMWVNQLAAVPANIGPRLFVLNTGATAADGTANSIAVKFQANNELFFEINTGTTMGSPQSIYPINKWLFFGWVYDGTNLYEYDGSDTQPAQLVSTITTNANQAVNLGASASLMLGNRGNLGRGFNGWIQDFRLYNGTSTNKLKFVESIRKEIAPKIPVITGIFPDGQSLLQATNTLVFNASAGGTFNLTNIDLKVNGADVSSSCTFVTNGTAGTSTNVSVSYANLPQQQAVTAVMTAIDGFGLVGSATVSFDTFSPTNFIIKAEEFDYNSGQFIDNPIYTTDGATTNETDSYNLLDSVEGVDSHKAQAAGAGNDVNCYRATDGTGTRTQTTLSTDLPAPTRFGGSGGIFNHGVNNWSSAEWQNYTKTFPSGMYNVYARVSTTSGSTINLDQVTSGQGTMNQALSRLGNFTFSGGGTYQWVPLRQFGSLAVVNLAGVNTVRATSGGGANANFYMLVPANTNLPSISGVYPDGQFLFEATNKLVFTVSSSVTTIATSNVVVILNGTNNVSTNLVFSGGPSVWNVSYTGLQLNQTYTVAIQVTDNLSASANANLTIDTWNPVFQVEAEAFDFDPAQSPIPNGTGNRYIDNSIPTAPQVPAANSFEGQTGVIDIDEHGNAKTNVSPIQAHFAGASPANYRTNDPCATPQVTDAARRQFVSGALDYNVGFLGPGHWENYTRTWPAGTFNVYARMASGANLGTLYSSWSQVVAGWGTTNEITKHLGSFAIPSSAGYSSYFYTPLIDRFGNYAQVTLGGTNTIRDTHLVFNQTETANGAVFGLNINFYMLLAARNDQARIDSVYPDGTTLMQGTNALSFVASSPTYGINTTNIHVTLNGVNVSSGLVFSGGPGSWNVSYPGLQPDSSYTAVITVTDNNNQTHTTTVNFDTFGANYFTWEGEDFDFEPASSIVTNNTGLRYIDNPVPTSVAASNSYFAQTGNPFDVDYAQAFANVSPSPLVYRTGDLVPMEVTGDAVRLRYQNAQLAQDDPNIQDYDIFNLTNNTIGGPTWVNYTRTFPAGNYYLRARVLAGTTLTNFQCTQVVGGSATNVLGYFQAAASANWQYAMLVNTNVGTNTVPVVVSLGGTNTLEMFGEGFERVNFFMLEPLPSVNLRASISGTNVVLSVPTQSSHSYIISYKNNLTDSSWTQLGSSLTGTGLIQTVTDSAVSQSRRFYQLTIQ
jgi:hypothetical protein